MIITLYKIIHTHLLVAAGMCNGDHRSRMMNIVRNTMVAIILCGVDSQLFYRPGQAVDAREVFQQKGSNTGDRYEFEKPKSLL